MELVPAILTADPLEARNLLEQIMKSKKFEKAQIDFIDGEYANNLTIKPMDLDLTPFLALDFEAHMMVVEKNLDEYIKGAEKVGYDQAIVQMESISSPEKHKALAIDIHSPLEAILPYLKNLELVTLMSIEPGFGGQEFDTHVIEKIKKLQEEKSKNSWKFKIQVDGGVQKEQLETLEKLGVDEAAIGAKRLLELASN